MRPAGAAQARLAAFEHADRAADIGLAVGGERGELGRQIDAAALIAEEQLEPVADASRSSSAKRESARARRHRRRGSRARARQRQGVREDRRDADAAGDQQIVRPPGTQSEMIAGSGDIEPRAGLKRPAYRRSRRATSGSRLTAIR